jgi:hypothetical protein
MYLLRSSSAYATIIQVMPREDTENTRTIASDSQNPKLGTIDWGLVRNLGTRNCPAAVAGEIAARLPRVGRYTWKARYAEQMFLVHALMVRICWR